MPKPADLLEFEPLSRYCTLEIGGPARYLLKVYSSKQLSDAICWAKENQIPWVVLGRGSNTLFDDRGYLGLVLVQRIATRQFSPSFTQGNRDHFVLDAAWPLPQLAATAMRKGYKGLEFACGIPGSLAGGVFMNAGAHGQCMSSVVEKVSFLDAKGQLHSLPKSALEFGYRKSFFQKNPGSVIVQVEISLEKDTSNEGRELLFAFAKKRRETQPQHCRSAGCFFRNPEDAPSAGALIEQSGCKGLFHHNVQVSAVHANFLIHCREDGSSSNLPSHSSEQMRELIAMVRSKVQENSGHYLESEVRFLPYDAEQFEII